MRLNAQRGGGITVDDAVPLRSRPQQLSFGLVERLDDKELLHALAHLVRGDHVRTEKRGHSRSSTWAPPSPTRIRRCGPAT